MSNKNYLNLIIKQFFVTKYKKIILKVNRLLANYRRRELKIKKIKNTFATSIATTMLPTTSSYRLTTTIPTTKSQFNSNKENISIKVKLPKEDFQSTTIENDYLSENSTIISNISNYNLINNINPVEIERNRKITKTISSIWSQILVADSSLIIKNPEDENKIVKQNNLNNEYLLKNFEAEHLNILKLNETAKISTKGRRFF